LGPLNDNLEKITASTGKYAKEVEGVAAAIGKLNALGSTTSGNLDSQTKAFDDLGKSISSISGLITNTTDVLKALMSSFAGENIADLIVGPFQGVKEIFTGLADGAMKSMQIFSEIFDAPSRDIRYFDDQMFSLGKRFGDSVGESQKFADSLKSQTFSQFGTTLMLTRDELKKYAEASSSTNLTFKDLNETIETTYGSTNLLAVATAFGESTNAHAGIVMRTLNDLIKKQGLSASEAADMLGLYAGVAKETGLSIESVTTSLNTAVSGFGKLGITADFGKPALEGFSRTVKEMGLGLEQAGSLASDLSSALAGVASNYSTAFIMSQRGGLQYGAGGGVLGSSIGLQAALLEAEKTGDQAQIGAELVSSLRDTLASFTGGEIVTVSEAAESPELQTQFYMQQQLLKSQFGLRDDASATRTLELLADIDEATKTGNIDAKRDLEEQLRTEVEGRDRLLGEFEKANRLLSAQSNYLAIIARPGLQELKFTGEQLRELFVDPAITVGGGKAAEALGGLAEGVGKGSKSILDYLDLNPDKFTEVAGSYQTADRLGVLEELGIDAEGMTDVAIERVIALYQAGNGSMGSGATSGNEELAGLIGKSVSESLGGRAVNVKISFEGEAERILKASSEMVDELGAGAGGRE
jgi:hypothetical protein